MNGFTTKAWRGEFPVERAIFREDEIERALDRIVGMEVDCEERHGRECGCYEARSEAVAIEVGCATLDALWDEAEALSLVSFGPVSTEGREYSMGDAR